MCPALVCSNTLGVCVECNTTGDCSASQVCETGVCVAGSAASCTSDRDCLGGETCVANACTMDPVDGDAPDAAQSDAGVPDAGTDDAATLDAFMRDAPSGSDAAAPPSPITQLAVGYSFACVMRALGDVYCWGGDPSYGSLGTGTVPYALDMPGPPVAGLVDAQAISCGDAHACALRRTGEVVCWGWNESGQLGGGTTTTTAWPSFPVAVGGLAASVAAVEAQVFSSCALLATGQVQCWGGNARGEIGDGTLVDPRLTPTFVIGLTSIVQLARGADHECVVRSDHSVYCWGMAEAAEVDGVLGSAPVTTPFTFPGFTADEVQVTSALSCARSGGTVSCWGSPPGLPRRLLSVPTPIPGVTDATQLAMGPTHVCVLRSGGTVACWGGNDYGQLGLGTTDGSMVAISPVGDVLGLTDAIQVGVGESFACALRATGDVVCWGRGAYGALGDGTNLDHDVPVAVLGLPH